MRMRTSRKILRRRGRPGGAHDTKMSSLGQVGRSQIEGNGGWGGMAWAHVGRVECNSCHTASIDSYSNLVHVCTCTCACVTCACAGVQP